MDTIVDTKVRRTWQIDAKRVTLSGKHWQGDLDKMVNRAAIGLGVADGVRAELYKLLVYDAGGFFIGHRDTEKAAGMFGTMVVVLPSSYSGGELVVKHQQQQVKLDLHFHEATGNEGVSFESAYRCAALVVWPQSHYLAIINMRWMPS
jgi:hypothetical protein